MPILPPIATSWPKPVKRCAVSAVVVDLPLVPVMATKRDSGATAARSRQKSSMSPMIGTPAALASATVQCGFGWVSGTPGASTKAAKLDQSASCRSTMTIPAEAAVSREACLSSQAATLAPPARRAWAASRPDAPRPNKARCLPAKEVRGVMVAPSVSRFEGGGWAAPPPSPQLQRRESDQGQDESDDPEADDDLRLGPPQLLEMMVDRRHPEHALAGHLERGDLDDHRHGFEHE